MQNAYVKVLQSTKNHADLLWYSNCVDNLYKLHVFDTANYFVHVASRVMRIAREDGMLCAADGGSLPEIEPISGGSTPKQYGVPEGAKDLQDLIEHREMNFALGNIFKACYRRGTCEHSDELRDMRKIVWFAEREIARLEKEQ